MLILVDSGSSHSFVSIALAARLQGVVRATRPLSVKIADGGKMICTQELINGEWTVQGHKFSSSFKVLSLGCYDMIIGMDWLEKHSPMDVHWARKKMSFLHHGKSIMLRGVQPQLTHCFQITSHQLQVMWEDNSV